jgi:EAL domain-containing protein (putative c-di-GMP-specific phosphodiesterase class I)
VVSIDDFGAGYTSLGHLASLPVGELKLDRTFVVGLSDGTGRDSDLIHASIELAHAMDLRVVAEGIEDQGSLDTLTRFGCDRVQGYLISHPRSAEALATWLDRLARPERDPPLAPTEVEQAHQR